MNVVIEEHICMVFSLQFRMHCKPKSKSLRKASVYYILVKIFELEVRYLISLKWEMDILESQKNVDWKGP